MSFNELLEEVQKIAGTDKVKVSDWSIWGNIGTTFNGELEDHYISIFYVDNGHTHNILGSKRMYKLEHKELEQTQHRQTVLEQFKEIAKNGQTTTD